MSGFSKTLFVAGTTIVLIVGVIVGLTLTSVKKPQAEKPSPPAEVRAREPLVPPSERMTTEAPAERTWLQERIPEMPGPKSPLEDDDSLKSLDPWGKKMVLGYLLRLPVLLDVLSAELGTTEAQKATLSEAAKAEEEQLHALNPSPWADDSSYEQRYRQILLGTDGRLRTVLTPLQYAGFRDWVIEGWTLARGELAPDPDQVGELGRHTIEFLKSQLGLSSQDEKMVSSLVEQYRREVLRLRVDLLRVVGDPLTPWDEVESKGREVAEEIKVVSQKFHEHMVDSLSPGLRAAYEELR